jgi:hypothetical protein
VDWRYLGAAKVNSLKKRATKRERSPRLMLVERKFTNSPS